MRMEVMETVSGLQCEWWPGNMSRWVLQTLSARSSPGTSQLCSHSFSLQLLLASDQWTNNNINTRSTLRTTISWSGDLGEETQDEQHNPPPPALTTHSDHISKEH